MSRQIPTGPTKKDLIKAIYKQRVLKDPMHSGSTMSLQTALTKCQLSDLSSLLLQANVAEMLTNVHFTKGVMAKFSQFRQYEKASLFYRSVCKMKPEMETSLWRDYMGTSVKTGHWVNALRLWQRVIANHRSGGERRGNFPVQSSLSLQASDYSNFIEACGGASHGLLWRHSLLALARMRQDRVAQFLRPRALTSLIHQTEAAGQWTAGIRAFTSVASLNSFIGNQQLPVLRRLLFLIYSKQVVCSVPNLWYSTLSYVSNFIQKTDFASTDTNLTGEHAKPRHTTEHRADILNLSIAIARAAGQIQVAEKVLNEVFDSAPHFGGVRPTSATFVANLIAPHSAGSSSKEEQRATHLFQLPPFPKIQQVLTQALEAADSPVSSDLLEAIFLRLFHDYRSSDAHALFKFFVARSLSDPSNVQNVISPVATGIIDALLYHPGPSEALVLADILKPTLQRVLPMISRGFLSWGDPTERWTVSGKKVCVIDSSVIFHRNFGRILSDLLGGPIDTSKTSHLKEKAKKTDERHAGGDAKEEMTKKKGELMSLSGVENAIIDPSGQRYYDAVLITASDLRTLVRAATFAKTLTHRREFSVEISSTVSAPLTDYQPLQMLGLPFQEGSWGGAMQQVNWATAEQNIEYLRRRIFTSIQRYPGIRLVPFIQQLRSNEALVQLNYQQPLLQKPSSPTHHNDGNSQEKNVWRPGGGISSQKHQGEQKVVPSTMLSVSNSQHQCIGVARTLQLLNPDTIVHVVTRKMTDNSTPHQALVPMLTVEQALQGCRKL